MTALREECEEKGAVVNLLARPMGRWIGVSTRCYHSMVMGTVVGVVEEMV